MDFSFLCSVFHGNAYILGCFPFVQAGAKVNISAGGATPLHIAADMGNTDIINCLVKAGADPNAADEVRSSCLCGVKI